MNLKSPSTLKIIFIKFLYKNDFKSSIKYLLECVAILSRSKNHAKRMTTKASEVVVTRITFRRRKTNFAENIPRHKDNSI